MAQKYRKKPVVIEAMLLQMVNAEQVINWINLKAEKEYAVLAPGKGVTIKTLEGNMLANVGDYVIKGVKGEFYPCKPDIFEATYEEVK